MVRRLYSDVPLVFDLYQEKRRLKLVVSISSVALSGTLWHDFQRGSPNRLLFCKPCLPLRGATIPYWDMDPFSIYFARLTSSCYRVELETIFEVYCDEYL